MGIRILIADDHSVVREGLRMFLGADRDFEIVGEAVDGAEAVERATALKPDVVLMDLMMPRMDGIAATAAIRAALPDTEVVALTTVLDDASVVGAVRAGAIGYLLKNTEGAELRRAVRAAAAGQVQLSPEAAAKLTAGLRPSVAKEKLTDREVEVLRLVAKGMNNREIAVTLVLAERTVKTHVSNIMAKLDVQSRTQAAVHAMNEGLIARAE